MGETNPKVSIIMPVYNTGPLLDQAVQSVLAQDFASFELLLVDDGSTDGSGDRCDAYAEKDRRVRVIHQENRGISAARNRGLEEARGDYIGFLDHDDTYLPGLLQENVPLGEKHQADVIRFERVRIRTYLDSGRVLEDRSGVRDLFTEGEEVLVLEEPFLQQDYPRIKRSGALYGVWNGLYRRAFLQEHQIRYDTRIRYGGEDLLFNLEVFGAARRYVFHKGVYYQYQRRIGKSTSTRFDINRLETLALIARREKTLLKGREDFPVWWLYYQADYCISIFQILLHRDCPWSWKKKVRFLRHLQRKTVFQNPTYRQSLSGVFKKSKALGLVAFLFYGGHFRLCALLVKGWGWMEEYLLGHREKRKAGRGNQQYGQ